jgi:SAM-dependent methyltransferase
MIPPQLERAVYGLHATHALHLADRHGVFAALAGRDGATAPDLAGELGLDPDTLERLLILLRSLGVLAAAPGAAYRLAPGTGDYLDPKSPAYLGAFVGHLLSSTAAQMPRLSEYLERGKAVVDAGRPEPFEVLYADDTAVAEFLAAMWDLSHAVSGELVVHAGLDRVHHLVDVGGAGGPFSVAALRAAPHLRATVFDLPAVAPHLAATRERHGLGERLGFTAGDFFRDPLPGGDAFAFGYILSDWTDETSLALLRKAHEACAPGGRVLVMERLFDDEGGGPLGTAVMNLSMHVETQGRHRSAPEYVALLETAGWRDCEVHRSTGDKHLVLGLKT